MGCLPSSCTRLAFCAEGAECPQLRGPGPGWAVKPAAPHSLWLLGLLSLCASCGFVSCVLSLRRKHVRPGCLGITDPEDCRRKWLPRRQAGPLDSELPSADVLTQCQQKPCPRGVACQGCGEVAEVLSLGGAASPHLPPAQALLGAECRPGSTPCGPSHPLPPRELVPSFNKHTSSPSLVRSALGRTRSESR